VNKILIAALTACGLTLAQGALVDYSVTFSRLGESLPNNSPGTGTGTAEYDPVAHTLHLLASFSDLEGGVTASHIHAPTATPNAGSAGVATTTPTFAGFPLGVTSGTYENTLDLTLASSYNPSFVAANGGTTANAEAVLTAAMAAGEAYWNIHTSSHPGGEIRGFLVPVPEVGTFMTGGLCLLGMIIAARNKKTSSVS